MGDVNPQELRGLTTKLLDLVQLGTDDGAVAATALAFALGAISRACGASREAAVQLVNDCWAAMDRAAPGENAGQPG